MEKLTPEQQKTFEALRQGAMDAAVSVAQDTLKEAQAAARLMAHVELLDNYQPRQDYPDEDESSDKAGSDKSSATHMQLLEPLVDVVVNDIYTQCFEQRQNKIAQGMPEVLLSSARDSAKVRVSANTFLQKAYHEAAKTLSNCSAQLQGQYPTVAKQIADLAKAKMGGQDARLTIKDYENLKNNSDGHFSASVVHHKVNRIINKAGRDITD